MLNQSIGRFLVKNGLSTSRGTVSFLKKHTVLVNSLPVTSRDFLFDWENDELIIDGQKIQNV
ncbi:MAG: hypothetical protein K5839_07275, partial [Treponemataceae bacterium]|nr:hypothetical protein [Treponemataceae bacterium]